MRLTAPLRPHPDTGERREVHGEAPTYDEAHQLLTAQIPDGWLALAVLRADD